MAIHQFEKELTELVKALKPAYDIAGALPPEMSSFRLRVQNTTRTEMNVINAQIGAGININGHQPSEPLTHIMGEPIERRAPVTTETLQPTNMERDNFIADRDNLYGQFLELKNNQIYTKSKMPGGDAVVRACAKKAGVENYADAKMGEKFIQSVRVAIQSEADLKK